MILLLLHHFSDKSADPFVFSLTLKPDPPVRGQELTVSASYTLSKTTTL